MTVRNFASGRTSLPAIAAAIAVGSVSALVLNTLPVFLTVVARIRGLDESQSGLIALADMGGIAVGSTLCALLPRVVHYCGWRRLAALGLLILILANILSAVAEPFALLLVMRALSGIGSGFVWAVTYAVLADGDGARDLAAFNVAQLSAGWLGIPFVSLIAERFGIAGLFGTIAVLAGAALFMCPLLPRGRAASPNAPTTVNVGSEKVSKAGWFAIGSVLLFFCGTGAVYAYLAFMGVAWGGERAAVESHLSTVLFSTVAGSLTSAFIASRYGYRRPLYTGYALLMTAILLLAILQPVLWFALFGCMFGFSWNLVSPFQFEAVTHVDNSSSAAILVGASTLSGIAIGPAIAGYLVTDTFMLVNLLALAACSASLLLLTHTIRLHVNAGPLPGRRAAA